MHIILLVIGAISTIAYVLYRIQAAAEAAKTIANEAKGVANLPRKMRYQAKARKAGSKLVDDPQEAAVILMLEIARLEGDVSQESRDAIQREIEINFEYSADDADQMIAQAAWLSTDRAGQDGLHRRMCSLITQSVTASDIDILAAMLGAVAETGCDPGDEKAALLASLLQRLGVSVN